MLKFFILILLSFQAYSQCFLAINPKTKQLECSPASVSGGAVGGASSLPTVGAIPYVTVPGVLGQDATALFWDATNDRLGVGTASPAYKFDILTSTANDRGINVAVTSATGTNYGQVLAVTGAATINYGSYLNVTGASNNIGIIIVAPAASANNWSIYSSSTAKSHHAGNFIVGGTVDDNYQFDVQASGSVGTFRAFNRVGGGSTLAVIQAGAAQSGNLLSIRSNAGADLFGITAAGMHQFTSIAEPTCNSGNRGVLTMVQGGAGVADTFRICSKDAADAYAYRALY